MCADRRPCSRQPGQRGLTLIELIVFIVVVGVGMLGILSVMNLTTQSGADPMQRKQAMALAEAVMEEILAKNATASLPETDMANCSNRARYVGVNDYTCFDGSTPAKRIAGNATLGAAQIPALARFSATVVVAPAVVAGVSLQRVTVTVAGGVEPIAVVAYKVAGL